MPPLPGCAPGEALYLCLTFPKTLGPGNGVEQGVVTAVNLANAGTSAADHNGVPAPGFTLLPETTPSRTQYTKERFPRHWAGVGEEQGS